MTDSVSLAQDAQLAKALQTFQNNPQELTQYLQQSQASLYKQVTAQKDGTFEKTYGDLRRATDIDKAVQFYKQRTTDLNALQANVGELLRTDAAAGQHDTDMAKRQTEINNWTASNRMDSLFVYQQAFIILCAAVVLTYLAQQGYLGSGPYYVLLGVLLVVFVFTVADRALYTSVLRNKRYWDQRLWPQERSKIPAPVPPCVGDVTAEISQGVSGISADISKAAASAESEAAAWYDEAKKEAARTEAAASADINAIYKNVSRDL